METAEQAQVETPTLESTEEFKPSSFSDALKPRAKAEMPAPAAPAQEMKSPETTTPTSVQVTQPETPKEEAKVETKTPQETGLLKAIQSERKKRQELEAQLASLRGGQQPQQSNPSVSPIMDQYMTVPQAPAAPDLNQAVQQIARRSDERFIAMSEHTARTTYKDYDEKEKSFAEAAEKNPNLLDVVIQSDNPGVTLYEIGKRYAFQKKYGTDGDEILSNVKKEVYAEVYSKVEADVLAKFKLKTNQPKDLSSVRAAGGSETPEPRSTGWKEALRK